MSKWKTVEEICAREQRRWCVHNGSVDMKRKLRAALIGVVDALAELTIDELHEVLGHGDLQSDIVEQLEQRHPAKYRAYHAKWNWYAQVQRRRQKGARRAAETRRAQTRW
jgi:hypothetical protein